ncbi:hypothetical protein [uncultured Chryseobacterium sp.]|uniref:hypothetical protein n=1 Tax=uncultured Chryseobacterium sp. TaxID=259322 RepID=UPI0025E951F3|nr:hypothetical protein [uncultured Chryseobacterium sp.]
MKKISLLIVTICSVLAFGQKISDYKYIAIPAKFSTFKKEDYGLGEMLTKTLRSKNYTVIPADKLQWPAEAQSNPCNVLTADVVNDSGLLRNKVVLQFKDCNDKVISSTKGSSNIKEYREGFQDALKQTFASISPASPINRIAEPHSAVQEVAVTAQLVEVPDQSAVKFSNGKTDLQKVLIDASQFILVGNNSSSPFATFKATTKNDLFRVKLQNGESTLGYYENGNIVIEMPHGNGSYTKEIFLKK